MLAAIYPSPSLSEMPPEKPTSNMSNSPSTQHKTLHGSDDALTETGNVLGNQQTAKLKEIADGIRACSEIADEFDIIFN